MSYKPQIKKLDYYESGSGGSSNTNDRLQNQELTDTYAYVGYEDSVNGSWYIYRRTRATNLRQYATGLSSYATNWTGRAGLTYV